MEQRASERERISRRRFLELGGAGLAGMGLYGLAGCGGGGESTGGGGGNAGNLRWSMWSGSPAETAVWKGLADDVHAKYPKINVALETVSFQDYWDKLTTQLASKGEADIVAMQQQRMPGFAVRNALRPLKEFIDKDPSVNVDDYFDPIRKGLSVNGDIYALGYDEGPAILYYNKDLFAKAKVDEPSPTEPLSWEEFRARAKALTNADQKQYGYVHSFIFDSMVPFLWSNGADYMDGAQKQCLLGSAEAKEAVSFVVDMITKDNCAAPITDLANETFATEAFTSGKAAMYIDGPWQFVNVDTSGDFEWDVAPMPAGRAGSVTYAAGSGFGISTHTDHADAAWSALKTIISPASITKLVEAGRGFPARQSVAPTFEKTKNAPGNAGLVEKVLDSKVGKSRPFATTTTWQETNVMLLRDFSPVFLGKQSVDDTMGKVVPEFNQLLERHQQLLQRIS
jgi:multiple sugar transport system substrate-binding protein